MNSITRKNTPPGSLALKSADYKDEVSDKDANLEQQQDYTSGEVKNQLGRYGMTDMMARLVKLTTGE